jgi:hypothetical protein
MTTHSKTPVHTEGEFTIIRWRLWGFRSESLSTLWILQNSRTGEELRTFSRLRDAKAEVARLAAPLRERICVAVDVNTAARALADTAE